MAGRLENALEFLIVSGAVTAIFYIVALFTKLISKKAIGTKKYYQWAFGTGVVVFFGLRAILLPTEQHEAGSTQIAANATGLDAPFIAPAKDKIESFIPQLKSAVDKLPPADKSQANDAIALITFCTAMNVKETDPSKFAVWGDSDLAANAMVKMYNFAKTNGDKMTLRKYIDLADEFKKQKPEWVKQYTAAKKELNKQNP